MESEVFWPDSKHLAEWLGVHIATVRRWRREHNAPRAIIMLLSCDLGIFDPQWAGWCVRDGLLRSPEGFELGVNDVLSYPFMRMQIAAYQSDNRKLRDLIDVGIEEQPQPCEWDLARVLEG